jgi:large subunit ribosomal protein L4
MIEAPHYSASGTKHAKKFALPRDTFDGVVNENVLHQAVKDFLANQRQGNAKTKTRSFVSGGNQKPWKQKGTGRARAGSSRSPVWVGGGTVFGPIPRDYRTDTNKKVRQLARRSAFNARAREGMVHVVDPFTMAAPKTSALMALLAKLSLAETKTLILTAGSKPPVYLSGRNVPHVDVLPFTDATAYDILHADALVIESAALGDGILMEGDATANVPPAPRVRAAKPAPRKAAGKKAAGKTKLAASGRKAKPKVARKAPVKKSSKKKGDK